MTTIYCIGYRNSGLEYSTTINTQNLDYFLIEWLPKQRQPWEWGEGAMSQARSFLSLVKQFYPSRFAIDIFYYLNKDKIAAISLQRLGIPDSFSIISTGDDLAGGIKERMELKPQYTIKFL